MYTQIDRYSQKKDNFQNAMKSVIKAKEYAGKIGYLSMNCYAPFYQKLLAIEWEK